MKHYAMPCHISDRLYEHTNGWTQAYALPDAEQLDKPDMPVKAIVICRISPLFKEMQNHVYFEAESLEEGHVGYFKGIPVFNPSIAFKTGAPIRLITAVNRQALNILEKFQ
jgi:hypothetical protein